MQGLDVGGPVGFSGRSGRRTTVGRRGIRGLAERPPVRTTARTRRSGSDGTGDTRAVA
ncbi:MAG: hypothetical protein V5A23_02600 [Halobacteriales archaeon]